MKKKILTGTVILALAGSGLSNARAGDREWATVGKVLTGVAAAGMIAAMLDRHAPGGVSCSFGPSVCYPAVPPPVCYGPGPVVCCPAPVPVYRTLSPCYPTHRWMRQERWHNGW